MYRVPRKKKTTEYHQETEFRKFPVVQWLGLRTFTTKGLGSIPGFNRGKHNSLLVRHVFILTSSPYKQKDFYHSLRTLQKGLNKDSSLKIKGQNTQQVIQMHCGIHTHRHPCAQVHTHICKNQPFQETTNKKRYQLIT